MMNSSVRLDYLNEENYDTWKMQMRASLIKNDAWGYVSGEIPKPSGDAADWVKNDRKAKSDIILSLGASELKQVKDCETSREVWVKLEGIYQSKKRKTSRKVALLSRLLESRMAEDDDIREHLDGFFDAVDKLAEIDIQINSDFLAILLLLSLPRSFDSFQCAILSRDEMPKPETIRMKLLEVHELRSNLESEFTENVVISSKKHSRKFESKRNYSRGQSNATKKFKFRCYGCGAYGHKVAECMNKAF